MLRVVGNCAKVDSASGERHGDLNGLREVESSLVSRNDPRTALHLSDGLYTFSFGLAAKISERLQLSVDVLDSFKNRPPTVATKKNDVALVTAIGAKF